MSALLVEIEVDAPQGRSLDFFPLGRVIRGRVDFARMRGDAAAKMLQEFPDAIPGQVLGLDAETGNAYVREPLHDAKHIAARRKIEKRGFDIPAEREDLRGVDVATWAHWMRVAVEAGLATVIVGKLPDVDGTPQLERFKQASRDDVIQTIVTQNQQLIELMGKLLTVTPEQREKAAKAVAK